MKNLNVKLSAVSLLVAIALLFGVVGAAALDGTTQVLRLTKTHVQINVTIPGGFDPGGRYGGMAGGKYFQCEAISADVLVCIGPLRAGSDPALLSIYDKSTKEIIFQHTIFPPRHFKEGEDEEPMPYVCNPDTDPFGCDIPQ